MACEPKCTPPEWIETWPQDQFPDGPPVHPWSRQKLYGTGITKIKKGTGCIYTQGGSGCCLMPTNGAPQPGDLLNPAIKAKREELRKAAMDAGDMKEPDDPKEKQMLKDRPEVW
jgi:hypothetical protein